MPSKSFKKKIRKSRSRFSKSSDSDMFVDNHEEDDQGQDLDAQLSWEELEQFLGRQIKVKLHQPTGTINPVHTVSGPLISINVDMGGFMLSPAHTNESSLSEKFVVFVDLVRDDLDVW